MIPLNAQGALATLLNLMALPGALMACMGGYMWFKGWQLKLENRTTAGRMLLMFGVILLTIVAILSFAINRLSSPLI